MTNLPNNTSDLADLDGRLTTYLMDHLAHVLTDATVRDTLHATVRVLAVEG